MDEGRWQHPGFAMRHPVVSFGLLAFGLSWVVGLAALVVLQQVLPTSFQGLAGVPLKYGPSAAGVAMAAVVVGRGGIRRLLGRLVPRRPGVIAWCVLAIMGPLLAFGAAAAYVCRGWSVPGWDAYVQQLAAFPALLAARTFLGGGLGEELGWRGFALPTLERRWSPLIASLLIGVVWLLWHVPAYLLNPASQEIPFALFGAFVLASSVVLTFVFDATGGELLPVVFLHASLNASAELMQVAGLDAAEVRSAVLGVTLALWVCAAALTPWLLRRRLAA